VFLRLCLLLTVLCVSPAAAGPGFDRLNDAWRWTTFTVEDSLPAHRILTIVELPSGDTWVQTRNGLSWYDGFRWHPAGRESGLPDGSEGAVIAARDDTLLVFAGGRVYRSSRRFFRELPLTGDRPDQAISAAATFPDGQVLLLNAGGTLFVLKERTLTLLPFTRGQPGGRITGIHGAQRGALVTCAGGLFLFDGRTWAPLIRAADSSFALGGLSENARGEGAAWVVSPREQTGLWMWKTGRPAVHISEKPSSVPTALLTTPDGDVLMVEETGGVRVSTADRINRLNPVPLQMVGSVFLQFRANGDLWAAGPTGLHLCRLSSRRWEYWNPAGTPQGTIVHEFLRHSTGSIWIATGNGLQVRRADGKMTEIPAVNGTQLGSVTGLGEDHDGNVWVTSGRSFTGAFRWDGTSWRRFGAAEGLQELPYHRIARDGSGGLWFLGDSVVRYSRGAFVVWGSEHDPLRSGTYAMAEGRDGALWFGTNRGLSVFANGTWRHWSTREGLRGNRVFTLAVDRDNRVWFGDQVHGLGCLEGTRLRYFSSADGLASDLVWDIKMDARGVLWIATRGGLTAYSEDSWTSFDYSSGLTYTGLWPVLPLADRVLLGTSGNGTAVLLLPSDRVPLPRITFNDPVIEPGRIHISWRSVAWWGECPAGGLSVRYRIDESPWSSWAPVRETVISRLPSGSHVFSIQVKDPFGRFDSRGHRLTFTIEPPVYLRPFFLLPVIALALSTIGLVAVLMVRRRRYRYELRLGEETSHALLNSSTDPAYLLDVHGTLLARNQAAAALPDAAALGTSVFSSLPPALAASRQAAVAEVIRTRSPLRFEDTQEGKFYEHHLYPVSDPSGRITRLALSSRDVTDRRQLEETLRSTVEFLRQILESSTTVAIISVNHSGRILYWNTGAAHILGFTSEEMVGHRTFGSLLPPEAAAEQTALLALSRGIVAGHQSESRVFPVIRKDGSSRLLRIALSPQAGTQEDVLGILMIAEDITEQETAKQEAELAERKLRLLAFTLNCARDAFIISDLKNTILFVNQATVEMYGFAEEELVGKNVRLLRPADFPPDLTEQIRTGTRAGGWAGEVQNVRKNGESFPIELWTSTVRNDQGEPVALVGVAREITRRKLVEARLRTSLREKEVLLKEIHHRVKNNLQVISSLLSLQASKLPGDDMVDILKESQTRVKSMALVHEELYQSDDFSRIDFADYAHRLTTSLFHTYRPETTPITLAVDVEEIFLTVDTAIPCGLIINELVSNALKYAFHGRESGRVVIRLARDGEEYRLTIADDGIGLPGNIDPETAESLGLQLVNTLTRQLGGTLTVTRGGGTQFTVAFVEQERAVMDRAKP
jgi:PAS domain S-box-containing protein